MTESQYAHSVFFLLPVSVQYESDLEGHAAPGGENVPTRTPQRRRLEDQRDGTQRSGEAAYLEACRMLLCLCFILDGAQKKDCLYAHG